MNLSAVWNDLLQGNFSHIWNGISHAHWSNVWAAISAIFTALAVIVAFFALIRWSKQDELKAKLAFKTAVCIYADQLVVLPVSLKNTGNRTRHLDGLKALTDQLLIVSNAFFACEHAILKHKEVVNAWKLITANHEEYIFGRVESHVLLDAAGKIRRLKFVY